MKGNDRTVMLVLPLIGLLLVFYFLVLGPKRQEASKLDEEIQSVQADIDEQEQVASFAEEARQEFPMYYGRLVVLGKAVPEEADSASLLVQVDSIADRSNVVFEGLEVATGGETEATAPPPPVEGAPSAETAEAPTTVPASTGTTSSTDPTTTAPAPATETTAANLPIGASVGPAGLPTLPYTLTFSGSFFDIAEFFEGVDRLVHLKADSELVAADGRLVTIDGFVLKGGGPGSTPTLETTLAVTTYITPAEQGLTGGATPGGPSLAATTTPASTGVTP